MYIGTWRYISEKKARQDDEWSLALTGTEYNEDTSLHSGIIHDLEGAPVVEIEHAAGRVRQAHYDDVSGSSSSGTVLSWTGLRTVHIDADGVESRSDHLLEYVEPEIRHRKAESVELSRAVSNEM